MRVLYMLRAPQKQYRTYRPKGERMDWTTGELLPEGPPVSKDCCGRAEWLS